MFAMFLTIMCLVVIFLTEVQIQAVSSKELLQFCQKNGRNNLAIASFEMQLVPVKAFVTATMKGFSSLQFSDSRFVPIQHNQNIDRFVADHIDYQRETLVLVGGILDLYNWDRYISIISQTKVKSGILVILEPMSNKHADEFYTKLQNFSENSYFYMLYTKRRQKNNSSNWDKVITLRNYHHPIVNPIEFDNLVEW